jgi:hypothetical protein
MYVITPRLRASGAFESGCRRMLVCVSISMLGRLTRDGPHRWLVQFLGQVDVDQCIFLPRDPVYKISGEVDLDAHERKSFTSEANPHEVCLLLVQVDGHGREWLPAQLAAGVAERKCAAQASYMRPYNSCTRTTSVLLVNTSDLHEEYSMRWIRHACFEDLRAPRFSGQHIFEDVNVERYLTHEMMPCQVILPVSHQYLC